MIEPAYRPDRPHRPDRRVVIVGSGHGGVQVAHSLREHGHEGAVVLISDEKELPYHRPPLSKTVLVDDEPAIDATLLRAEGFYAARRITMRRQSRATRLDLAGRRIELADGTVEDFDELVLATGSRARELPVPGHDLAGVVRVRTMAEALTLRALLARPRLRVVIVGGGYIGLEIASVASGIGHDVTIVEGLDRLLARSLSPEIGDHVARAHRDRGSRLELGAAVVSFTGDRSGVSGVALASGEVLPADLVVVGVGGLPNSELAADAGLSICPVTRGVVVDEHLRTTAAHVSAIGDCATFPSPHGAGSPVRLESVQNAVDQARHVAARITGGPDAPYATVPWFWSDQCGLKLQSVGLAGADGDRVVLGSPAAGDFSVLRFEGDVLAAVDSVNRPADHMAARRILGGSRRPSPAAARRPDFGLKQFLVVG